MLGYPAEALLGLIRLPQFPAGNLMSRAGPSETKGEPSDKGESREERVEFRLPQRTIQFASRRSS